MATSSSSSPFPSAEENSRKQLLMEIRNHEIAIGELSSLPASRKSLTQPSLSCRNLIKLDEQIFTKKRFLKDSFGPWACNIILLESCMRCFVFKELYVVFVF
ncbi:hypothetical protein HPP92_008192 [Vanilla planifolia]|uniref:Uncharacterized protein n=1 Tax=Vanilla planifolia TaxID=51239 RepID=A0A835V5F7_VANPL|nr:hypothetical protein HPP92_008192 [Vanilla planifolia]